MKKHALYYSKYCYFCQKVLMRLKGKEHQIELRSVSDQDNHNALLQGGGKTQVPCLKIESVGEPENQKEGQPTATWLYESDDIIHYIAENDLLVN